MVSFQLSEEQQMVTDTMREFALEQLRPIARECDEKGEIPADIAKKFWELGLLQNIIPQEYKGFGEAHSVLLGAMVAEELAYGDLSLAMHLLSPGLFAIPILEMGTEEQKQKYLPLFCEPEFKPATMAVVEPRFDFDLASLSTAAVLDGGEYVIKGEKCFVPLGGSSDLYLIFASTTKGAGYSGVDGFIVEKGTPNLQVKEREKNMGLKALETNEIVLNDCRVPKENQLGSSRGVDFLKLMDISRIGLAAMAIGVAKAAFEYSRDYAKERQAFGEPIASRQAIAFMIGEIAMEIDATRLLVWEAAWKMDRGENCTKEAYLAKRYAAEMVMKATDRALQILGGHGYIREHPVELWMRNGRGFSTFEGNIIV